MSSNGYSVVQARAYITESIKGIYPQNEAKAIAYIVLAHVTHAGKHTLMTGEDIFLDTDQWDKISKICDQLKEFKPVQYAIGETSFYGLDLWVDETTLIPRQETEELVDLVIRENRNGSPRIIDIGTGSGCIAIALAVNLPMSHVTATDISANALEVARRNASRHGCSIDFRLENMEKPGSGPGTTYDIVVSNPPYVLESEKKLMHRNVLDWEPASALFVSDRDPLLYYRALGEFSRQFLETGGAIYLEINEAYGNETASLLRDNSFRNVRIINDLNGKERIVTGKKA